MDKQRENRYQSASEFVDELIIFDREELSIGPKKDKMKVLKKAYLLKKKCSKIKQERKWNKTSEWQDNLLKIAKYKNAIVILTVSLCLVIILFYSTSNKNHFSTHDTKRLHKSLIAYYPFEGSAKDVSGNKLHGIVKRAIITTGRKGLAYHFNGNSYIAIPVDISPNKYPQLTMGCWVKTKQLKGEVISHDNGTWDRALRLDNKGCSANTGYGGMGFKPVKKNTWTFLAIVYDDSKATTVLYVNNKTVISGGKPGLGFNFTQIGGNAFFKSFFIGDIDDVFFFSEALNAKQLHDIMVEGVRFRKSSGTKKEIPAGWPTIAKAVDFYSKENHKEAKKWFNIAASQGNVSAFFQLGTIYYNGTRITKNYQEAVKWLHKAAKLNYTPAFHDLGVLYYKGKGAEQDYQEAAKWFQKGASKSDINAMTWFGYIYKNGQGVKQDYQKAIHWNLKAAIHGHSSAQYNLGAIYYQEKDYQRSLYWFLKAVKTEHSAAQFYLGLLFYEGKGTKQDYQKAIKWFLKAANKGDANAMSWLGYMYNLGIGVKEDLKKSLYWYSKASKLGHIYAMKELKSLRKKYVRLPNRNLVAFYSFNKQKRKQIVDESGNKNHGKVHGAKWVKNGKVGGAYKFDGKSYIDFGNKKAFKITKAITVCAWFRIKSTKGNPTIISKTEAASYAIFILGGRLVFSVYIVNQYFSPGVSLKNIQTDTWYHVAGTYNGNEIRFYLNGVLKEAIDKKGVIRDSPNTSLWVGAEPYYSRPQTDSDYFFRGTIDEVMIYNRALSNDEINRIYSFQK